jgi:hypothetical protein
MSCPVEMTRWTRAFDELCAAVLDVARQRIPSSELPDTWVWIRLNYAASLAAYSFMTPAQQSMVRDRLDALGEKLQSMSTDD